jgi:hypothetical protein
MINSLQKNRRRMSIAFGVVAVSPTFIGLFMFLVTPRYFRPLFEGSIGLLLLGTLVATMCVGYALLQASARLFRKGRAALGVLLLAVYTMFWGVAFWIVMLGPAVLILMKPRS